MKLVKYITPNCCDKAKTTQTVRLGLYPDTVNYGEWKNIKPKWYIVGDEIYGRQHFPTKVEILNCPFCNTILPDLEKSDIKKITEGDEEYCRTCNQRNMVCDCYPPEFRWKIKE